MEFNGQTGFEYMTDGTTKTFSFGLSNKIDESIAAFIDRINAGSVYDSGLHRLRAFRD